MTTTTTERTKRQRPKPERRVKLLFQPAPDTDYWGAIELTVGKKTDRYLVHFIPSDFGNGAIGLEVEKLADSLETVEVYHVHLSNAPQDRSCDCRGCSRHGHCKHLDGLDALRKAGRLLPIVKDEPPPPDDAA